MRLRLSRFMTKGAPVFMQPPKVESRVLNQKSNYQPHVHFSRSLTNGSNGEQKDEENFQDALQDVQSRLHKGRPNRGKKQASMTGDEEMNGNQCNEMFKNQETQEVGTENSNSARKKSAKKSTGGARPKSTRAVGKRQKSSKTATSTNLQDLQDELLMEPEEDHARVGNLASPGHDSHPDSESKHDSEVGDGHDDTSKDFTSLSLATASASGGKQTNPKISVTDDAQ